MDENAAAGPDLAELRLRLEQTDRRMFELVAWLAHELRTPLGAILMWAHVLRTGRDEDRVPALDAIETSARTQSKMIESVLDVARALAGRLQLSLSAVDLGSAVRAAVEAMDPLARARGIELVPSIAGVPVLVDGDAARLLQMTSQLLENGIKFTPPGGVVEVRLMRAAGVARLVVHDNGRGLAREMLTEVFAPFRPAAVGESRAAGSLGVGLAFVRVVAELHGGRATADSEGPGRGSTFTVELPLQAG